MAHATLSRRMSRLICALALLASPCAWAQPAKPDNPAPPQTSGQAPSENLSDRLNRSGGVIAPPPGVPDIQVAPPDPGPSPMPVIPPPGSPGGDQRIQPK